MEVYLRIGCQEIIFILLQGEMIDQRDVAIPSSRVLYKDYFCTLKNQRFKAPLKSKKYFNFDEILYFGFTSLSRQNDKTEFFTIKR